MGSLPRWVSFISEYLSRKRIPSLSRKWPVHAYMWLYPRCKLWTEFSFPSKYVEMCYHPFCPKRRKSMKQEKEKDLPSNPHTTEICIHAQQHTTYRPTHQDSYAGIKTHTRHIHITQHYWGSCWLFCSWSQTLKRPGTLSSLNHPGMLSLNFVVYLSSCWLISLAFSPEIAQSKILLQQKNLIKSQILLKFQNYTLINQYKLGSILTVFDKCLLA